MTRMTPTRARRLAGAAAMGAALAGASPLAAQARPTGGPMSPTVRAISLDEALRLAERTSEAVRVARAGVERARGTAAQARSQYLPQVYGSAGFTKTLASQFESLQGSGGPPATPATGPDTIQRSLCAPYYLGADATPAQRQAALAVAQTCSGGLGFDFSNLPFGRENQYTLGLQVSQNLFDGGRTLAQNRIARSGARVADVELAAQRAQTQLDVAQAYYDAALTDRLVQIAESSLSWSERALRQTRLARQVGTTAEFNLLQAQVARDNQLPVVLQQRTNRELAYLRLKQLLDLPLGDTLRLTTPLLDSAAVTPAARVAAGAPGGTPVTPVSTGGLAPDVDALTLLARADTLPLPPSDTAAGSRATVRQAEEAVRVQEGMLRVARSQRIPAISLTSQYGRVAYPNGYAPAWSDFLTNWTVGVGVTVPLFTGGRIRGEAVVAQANVAEAKARLDQARELAALDARSSLAQYREAELSWLASAGTADQASRAHRIAEVRYAEGISTQLELSQSALLLEQSLANRALAARNLNVARMRLTLLRDLPLQAGGAQGMPAQGAQQGAQQGGAMGARAGASTQQAPQAPGGTSASTSLTGPGGTIP